MSAQTRQTRWKLTRPAPARGGSPGTDLDRNPARVLSVIALASIAAGAINLAAAVSFRSNAENLAFFTVVTVAQLVWGASVLVRAPRWWVALGGAGNLVVAAVWVVSRTAGLPAGPEAGITLPVHFADALATALEIVVVLGAVALLARGRAPARALTVSPVFAVAAGLVAAALTLGGVLSQSGVFNSSPAGGGSGVSGPSSPGGGGGGNGGGGGSSGGGTSGGGYGY
ncbi:MAG: hypothetical protein J2P32_05095 [Actinobacteria bacterium]|nr:hypothetical protein [Actinomycetota bacterium]